MKAWRYRRVRLTGAGADGGIDVEAEGAVAQVKAWMVPVGRPEIQRLRGAAYDGRTPLFFSLTAYTSAAVEFANSCGVALFRFSGYSGEIEAVNDSARKLILDRRRLAWQLSGQSPREHPAFFSVLRVVELVIDDRRARKISSDFYPECSVHVRRNDEALFVGFSTLYEYQDVSSGRAFQARHELSAEELEVLGELGWPLVAKDGFYWLHCTGPAFHEADAAELIVRTLIELLGLQSLDDLTVTLPRPDVETSEQRPGCMPCGCIVVLVPALSAGVGLVATMF
jgi:hypothetical protein